MTRNSDCNTEQPSTLNAQQIIIGFMSFVVVSLCGWIAINVNQQQITLAELRIELKAIGVNQQDLKSNEKEIKKTMANHEQRLNRLEWVAPN